MEFTIKLFTVGNKNANGLIYSKEMARSIIQKFEDHGYIFGMRGSLNDEGGIPVLKATHKANRVWLEDEKHLMVTIEILDTPAGQDFKEYYNENKNDIIFKPEGTGKIDNSSKIIYDYNVLGINAILKSETQTQTVIDNNED